MLILTAICFFFIAPKLPLTGPKLPLTASKLPLTTFQLPLTLMEILMPPNGNLGLVNGNLGVIEKLKLAVIIGKFLFFFCCQKQQFAVFLY